MRPEFNLIDAFRLLDPHGRGSVSKHDLAINLQRLGIEPTNAELTVFMKRFDKDNDSMLRYSEFCEAFLPIDSFHASLLAKKSPGECAFSPETVAHYKGIWKQHFDTETQIE